jgi:CAAX prenyl protease-like protein
MMAADRIFKLPAQISYPLRFVVVLLLLLAARQYISLRPRFALQTVVVGTAVFVLWVAPDLLFGYRHFWLFENSLTGRVASTIDPALRRSVPFAILRAAGCALLVPVFEELFWRSWLMRWLIEPRFEKIPFGTYSRSAFWTVAALFAVEHGPYWEVGLAAGIVFNWWAVRTRSLADCILAHAVTNALLSAFVLFTGQWQYWS